MKKSISFFVCLAMLISFASPCFANKNQTSAEKVLEAIKPRIGETNHFENFETSYTETDNGKKIYTFFWYNSGEEYSELSISATESGIITSYNSYTQSKNSQSEKPTINKPDSAEVQKNAQNFVDKLNPDLKGKLFVENNLEQNVFSNSYRFLIKRYENSVLADFDGGRIILNGNGNELKSFSLSFSENLDFPIPKNTISKEEAIELYKQKLGIELKYADKYTKDNKVILPVYDEKNSNSQKYINAFSGEITKSNILVYDFENEKFEAAQDSAGGSSQNFSAVEEKELSKLSNILTKEKITQILKNNKYINLPKTAILSSSNLYKNENEEFVYNLRFKQENKNNISTYYNYSTNAKNGFVLSFSTFGKDDTQKTNISKEKAYETLFSAVKNLSSEKFSEYEETEFFYPEKETDNFATICFTRKINNIPYESNKIYTELNLKTQKISNYHIDYTKVDFPSTTDAISTEDAYSAIFEKIPYTLGYIQNGEKAELVYMFEKSPVTVDASTGKLLDYSLNEIAEEKTAYTDLKNHYAKEKIEKLLSFGIGFSTDKFKPDENIKQKDFMALLVAAFSNQKLNSETDCEQIYKIAKQNGYIKDDEISFNSDVSRISAAKFVIRAMGYAPVAKLENIFKTKFSDVQTDVGYAAILGEMNIINGDENNLFNPNNNLTRADGAIIIYNCLNR